MKAARKAHGESTDVGTEEDLWGPLKAIEEHHADDTAPRVTMSMPTHLEIGLLPTSTVPPDPGQCAVGVVAPDRFPLLPLVPSHSMWLPHSPCDWSPPLFNVGGCSYPTHFVIGLLPSSTIPFIIGGRCCSTHLKIGFLPSSTIQWYVEWWM